MIILLVVNFIYPANIIKVINFIYPANIIKVIIIAAKARNDKIIMFLDLSTSRTAVIRACHVQTEVRSCMAGAINYITHTLQVGQIT